MNGGIGKAIAATTAVSLACEVPLPALVDEVVVAEQAEPLTLGNVEFEVTVRDLPQAFANEGYLPETSDPDAPRAGRRAVREFPR